MKAYYRLPAATAAAIDRDGWFHTGDLGTMDGNGYVRITGRLKDVIARDGVDIYPVDIEEVIYQLPQVSEVQVFGFEHPTGGLEIAAWLKVKEETPLALTDVAAHLQKRLPPEKQPAHLKIVSSFPMTGSGKVQKFKLAQMAAKEYGGNE
jgi:fatty-acyl-CoA synthase